MSTKTDFQIEKMLSKANIGAWIIEIDENKEPRMYGNERMKELIGIEGELSPEEWYKAWYDNIDIDCYEDVQNAVSQMTNGENAEVEYTWFHPSKGLMYVRCGGVRDFSYEEGVRLEGVHRDISKLIHIQNNPENTSKVLANANIGLWAIEIDEGKEPRMYGDDTMLRLLGVKAKISPEELYHAWYDNIDPAFYDEVNATVASIVEGKSSEVQYPWNHPQFGEMYVRCGGILNQNYSRGVRLEGCHRDVTKLIRFQKKVETMEEQLLAAKDMVEEASKKAAYDSFTGALNHTHFIEKANLLLKNNRKQHKNSHLIYIDVDNLKSINDTYGHSEGDYCIIAVSSALKEIVDEHGIIGRMGGDEFAILLSEKSTENVLLKFEQELDVLIKKINEESGKSYIIEFSKGVISILDGEKRTAEDAINIADMRMYEQKRLKKGL